MSVFSVVSCGGWDDFCLPEPRPFPVICHKLPIVCPHSHVSACLPHCFSTLSWLDCYWACLAKKTQTARTGKRSRCDLKRSRLWAKALRFHLLRVCKAVMVETTASRRNAQITESCCQQIVCLEMLVILHFSQHRRQANQKCHQQLNHEMFVFFFLKDL